MSVQLFLAHIIKHFRLLKDQDIVQLAYRFGISKEEAIQIMETNGWETEEGKEGYFSPTVKDRNSMIDKTDFKQNQIDDDYIDQVRLNDA